VRHRAAGHPTLSTPWPRELLQSIGHLYPEPLREWLKASMIPGYSATPSAKAARLLASALPLGDAAVALLRAWRVRTDTARVSARGVSHASFSLTRVRTGCRPKS
jgi:hypothetical protein